MTSKLTNQNVLVTGGAGFIGSNLANYLVDENSVTVLDDLSLGVKENLKEDVSFIKGSVINDDLPINKDTDVVFHLAALSSLNMHEDRPVRGSEVNVSGFVNIAEKALENNVEDIVYASTSSIYGSRTDPSREDEIVESRTRYEASKLARERYAEAYANRYGMNTVGLRFFSVYQGYDGCEEHKDEYANVISQFAESMSNGEQPLVYGDGRQTRDFTYVSDIVRACEKAVGEHNEVYNVGTGDPRSFNEVVNEINKQLGTDIKPDYTDNPIPEHVYVHDTCADITKIKDNLGWKPEVSFEEGIKKVCDPYSD
jgi:UDP-glucose 4-epimerase